MRLACSPTDPQAQVRFDSLGVQALLAEGLVRQPDSEPHPIVRAFLIDAQQAGLDVRQTFGRVISPRSVARATAGSFWTTWRSRFKPASPNRYAWCRWAAG
jgi:hypothetical protein